MAAAELHLCKSPCSRAIVTRLPQAPESSDQEPKTGSNQIDNADMFILESMSRNINHATFNGLIKSIFQNSQSEDPANTDKSNSIELKPTSTLEQPKTT